MEQLAHYHVHVRPPQVLNLNHINPVYTLQTDLPEILFNIILLPTPRSDMFLPFNITN
jgi:hypothetical protein